MEEELEDKIINLFKKSAIEGYLMLSIPEVAASLKLDRRKIEPTLVLLSKGRDPKLCEVAKGRIKYYILKEVLDFCKNKWGSISEETK